MGSGARHIECSLMGAIKPWHLLICCVLVMFIIAALTAVIIQATRKKK
jgi:hypothetical protein